jgi:anti-sigma B factor antagonist
MAAELGIDADTTAEGAALLTITGEVDMHTAPQFHQALTHAATRHPRLSVDLTATAYLDSAGIAALFDVARHTQLELILGPGCLVTPVIEICKLDQVATISVRQ